jgi:hypothetical protein
MPVSQSWWCTGFLREKHENAKAGRRAHGKENAKMGTEVQKRESRTATYRFERMESPGLEILRGENLQRRMIFSGSNGASMQNICLHCPAIAVLLSGRTALLGNR